MKRLFRSMYRFVVTGGGGYAARVAMRFGTILFSG